MKIVEIEINAEVLKIPVEKIGKEMWYHYRGETHVYEPVKYSRKTSDKLTVEASGQLHSPMPGKVFKIVKKQGDAVKSGDTIVYIEAMKMEYKIQAPFDGMVKQVNCNIGETVQLGQILAIIEPSQE